MSFVHVLRIERGECEWVRHEVVHTRDPKFSLELTPDREARGEAVPRALTRRLGR